jgi:hypothetical protein
LFGAAAVGSTLGMAAAIALTHPTDVGATGRITRLGLAPSPIKRVTVDLPGMSGASILGLVRRAPGVYPLLHVGF